ncbi:MAG: hypothetical protein RBR37_13015 [Advenella sp.]|nr:hypothetical protein [Advenella sp.]
MKLHFEPNLDYQTQTIEAVCDFFHDQEVCRTEFTVTIKLPEQQLTLGVAETDLGIGNLDIRGVSEPPARYMVATSFSDVLKTMV